MKLSLGLAAFGSGLGGALALAISGAASSALAGRTLTVYMDKGLIQLAL